MIFKRRVLPTIMMKPKLMIEPSCWLGTGIKLKQVNGLSFFQFTDKLQVRSDELLERSKVGTTTPEEKAELDGISELAQIFTYANSVLAANHLDVFEFEWDYILLKPIHA